MKPMSAALLLAALLPACAREPAPPDERDRALERAVQEPLDRARALEEEARKARAAQDQRLRDEGG